MRVACLITIAVAGLLATRAANTFELLGTVWPTATSTFDVEIGIWNDAFEGAMADWTTATNFTYRINRNSFTDPCVFTDNRNGVAFAFTICGVAWGSTTLAITGI